MQRLPITRMTLYKHGVGFFERRAKLSGEEVELSYRVEEMNDVLKSLTAIDFGDGQVLGVDYPTPQSQEERLAGCSIELGDSRSLRDLLISLQGRRVCLHLAQGESIPGIVLGIDEPPEKQPMNSGLVSILMEDDQVHVAELSRLNNVEILDEEGSRDLRFFLQTALGQDAYRRVTVRLTPGEHELSVSYIAPAPSWRVSYRLVTDKVSAEGTGDMLLQGWGIFDNRLEEELKDIQLSLVAGMPISFIYDLYTPSMPERPVIEEESRVAAAPVELGAKMSRDMLGSEVEAMRAAPEAMRALSQSRAAPGMGITMAAMDKAAAVATTGKELGQLFQYNIATPVTVGRGQSAMVPIISSKLPFHKDLIYNGQKLPAHPVATMRLKNDTGLTLERGPVTVIESGEYVGEAILPFTAPSGEIVVPYAVELGLKVTEEAGSHRETRGLSIKEVYFHFEEWEINWRDYRLHNHTNKAFTVLVEHPRSTAYKLFDTPEPVEETEEQRRFAVVVPPHKEVTLRIQERRPTWRREELHKQSYEGLQRYLQQGLIDQNTMDKVVKLLILWENIATYETKLQECEAERQKVYAAQQQIQGNMAALSQDGKEGTLRMQYVDKLGKSEEQLKSIAKQEAELKDEIKRVKKELEERVKAL